MLPQILEYNVVRYVAACGAKVPSGPKPTSPISFAQRWKLLLNFARRTPLHALHELTNRNMWRNFYKHVDVIGGKYAADNFNTQLRANLFDNYANPFPYFPAQNLVAVFGNPNDMITMMKNRMTSCRVA